MPTPPPTTMYIHPFLLFLPIEYQQGLRTGTRRRKATTAFTPSISPHFHDTDTTTETTTFIHIHTYMKRYPQLCTIPPLQDVIMRAIIGANIYFILHTQPTNIKRTAEWSHKVSGEFTLNLHKFDKINHHEAQWIKKCGYEMVTDVSLLFTPFYSFFVVDARDSVSHKIPFRHNKLSLIIVARFAVTFYPLQDTYK